MFKRCVFYFMIGILGLAYSMLWEIYGYKSSQITYALGILGRLVFYLMSILFILELSCRTYKYFKA